MRPRPQFLSAGLVSALAFLTVPESRAHSWSGSGIPSVDGESPVLNMAFSKGMKFKMQYHRGNLLGRDILLVKAFHLIK